MCLILKFDFNFLFFLENNCRVINCLFEYILVCMIYGNFEDCLEMYR